MTKYSRIIAGVMNWGVWGAGLSKGAISKLIGECIDIGVTSFDQADIYGDHTTESDWGTAWADMRIDREKIQIISKCGIMRPSDARPSIKDKHYDTSQRHIIASVDTSLKNLKTDYLDMLLIHRPSPLMDPGEIAEAVRKLKTSGKIRDFGVSNFTPNQTNLLLSEVRIDCNQIEISPFALSSFTDGTLDQCILKDIIPMAWSPMGGGALFDLATAPSILSQRERLNNVAKKYNWKLDEMVYLFLLHHPALIRPVTGSSKIERIKIASDSVNTYITDAQWFEILAAAKGEDVA